MFRRFALFAIAVLCLASLGHAQTRANGSTTIIPGPNPQLCFEPTFGAGPDVCIQRTGPNGLQQTNGIGTTGTPLGGGGGTAGPNIINALNPTYNLPVDGRRAFDVTTTNASNILTSASANFLTNAVPGQVIFCTNVSPNGGGNFLVSAVNLPQTTIQSVDSNTQIHTVGNANASAATNSHCFWGTLATLAWKNIWNAATALCGGVLGPGGVFLVDGPEFNTIPVSCAIAFGSSRSGIDWIGQGIASTVLVPVPNFSRTNPNGDSLGVSNGYFWSKGNNINVRNVTVDCGGNSAFGTSGDSLVALQQVDGNNASMDHVHLMGCGGGNGPFTGMTIGGGVVGLSYVHVDGSGGVCLNIAGGVLTQIWGTGSFFGDCSNKAITIAANSTLRTSGLTICNAATVTVGECVFVSNGATWDSSGDIIEDASANTNQVGIQNAGGTVTLRDTALTMNGPNNLGIWANTSGAKTHLCNVTMSILGSGSTEFLTAAGTGLFDDCPNSMSGTALGTISGAVFGSASATGTALATSNIGLTSGWGTSSVASAIGDSHQGKFTITGAVGSASPTLTLTFPTAYPLTAPASCILFETGANDLASLTSVSAGAPSTTSVLFTFVGTPAAVTYVFDYKCGP